MIYTEYLYTTKTLVSATFNWAKLCTIGQNFSNQSTPGGFTYRMHPLLKPLGNLIRNYPSPSKLAGISAGHPRRRRGRLPQGSPEGCEGKGNGISLYYIWKEE